MRPALVPICGDGRACGYCGGQLTCSRVSVVVASNSGGHWVLDRVASDEVVVNNCSMSSDNKCLTKSPMASGWTIDQQGCCTDANHCTIFLRWSRQVPLRELTPEEPDRLMRGEGVLTLRYEIFHPSPRRVFVVQMTKTLLVSSATYILMPDIFKTQAVKLRSRMIF